MMSGGGTEVMASHGSILGPGHNAVLTDSDVDVFVYYYYANDGTASWVLTSFATSRIGPLCIRQCKCSFVFLFNTWTAFSSPKSGTLMYMYQVRWLKTRADCLFTALRLSCSIFIYTTTCLSLQLQKVKFGLLVISTFIVRNSLKELNNELLGILLVIRCIWLCSAMSRNGRG